MMIHTVLIMMMTVAKCLGECGSGTVCLPNDASIPRGYLATEPCGNSSTCYLQRYEVCFGPFGDLPQATRLFSDKYLFDRSGLVQKIDIFVGDFAGNANIITGIQVTYGNVVGPMHGGPGQTNITCETTGDGLFFGGVFGRARTQRTFDSFIYLLGFTETTTGQDLCVAGTDNQNVYPFDIQAPSSTTFTLAFILGAETTDNSMLGSLTFCFRSVSY